MGEKTQNLSRSCGKNGTRVANLTVIEERGGADADKRFINSGRILQRTVFSASGSLLKQVCPAQMETLSRK